MVKKEIPGAKIDTNFPLMYPKSGVAKRATGSPNSKLLSSTKENVSANLPLSGESSNGPSTHFGSFILILFGFPGIPLTVKNRTKKTIKTNSIFFIFSDNKLQAKAQYLL